MRNARSRVVSFPRQLLINKSRKLVLGLGAGELNSIDEESRRPGNTGLPAFLDILINVRLVLAARQAGAKLLVIELQLARVFDQSVLVQVRRGEKLVVVLPEPSLVQGAPR